MKLSPAGRPDVEPEARLFRHSPWSDLFGALVMLAVLAGGGYAVTQMVGALPLAMWLVAGPVVLVCALVMPVVTMTMVGAFRSSLTDANWLAIVDRERVFFNLRSYRNRHFAGEEPTVVEFGASEIATVGKVTETSYEKRGRERRMRRQQTIELHLRGVDTTPLANAIEAERVRKEPRRTEGGGRSSLKHHHVPVFVLRPGVLRVERVGGLFEALAEHASVAPEQQIDLDAELAERSPEERASELALRGERMAAERVLRDELGLDGGDAERWLEGRPAA